jgi:hypothetical protein
MRRPGESAQPHPGAKSGGQRQREQPQPWVVPVSALQHPAGVVETQRTYHFEIAHDASTPPYMFNPSNGQKKKIAHPHHTKILKFTTKFNPFQFF